jgi:hypothetical protein
MEGPGCFERKEEKELVGKEGEEEEAKSQT